MAPRLTDDSLSAPTGGLLPLVRCELALTGSSRLWPVFHVGGFFACPWQACVANLNVRPAPHEADTIQNHQHVQRRTCRTRRTCTPDRGVSMPDNTSADHSGILAQPSLTTGTDTLGFGSRTIGSFALTFTRSGKLVARRTCG